MKTLVLLFAMSVASVAQIVPPPDCFTSVKHGDFTVKCLYIQMPHLGQFDNNEFMVMMASDSPITANFTVSATFIDSDGNTSILHASSGEVSVTAEQKAIAILYVPANSVLTLKSLIICRVIKLGNFGSQHTHQTP